MKSRVHEAKNHISDLEYKEAKNTQSEQQKEKRIQMTSKTKIRLKYKTSLKCGNENTKICNVIPYFLFLSSTGLLYLLCNTFIWLLGN